jgi:hypothetical protein
MEEFYWNIVSIFESAGEFGQELLAWWDKYVSWPLLFKTLAYHTDSGKYLASALLRRAKLISQKNQHYSTCNYREF